MRLAGVNVIPKEHGRGLSGPVRPLQKYVVVGSNVFGDR